MRDIQAVRPLKATEAPHLRPLLDKALRAAPYSSTMDEIAIHEQIFRANPPTLHQVRWQRHLPLGAWRRNRLLGFLDAATGFDSDYLHLPDDEPLGLLRFLALSSAATAESKTADSVAMALLGAAADFWQEAGIRRVRAFTHSSGYPSFQSGAGTLPGSWADHQRWLTTAGYRLAARYYCLLYPLTRPVVEYTPPPGLTIWPQIHHDERRYQLFFRSEPVAIARLRLRNVVVPEDVNPVAYLADLRVAKDWRRRGIGHWLVRRSLNDAFLLGCRQVVLHVNHAQHPAISLFTQVGFEEINYRGYVLEKIL